MIDPKQYHKDTSKKSQLTKTLRIKENLTLEQMQGICGGYIEIIKLPVDKAKMVMNEEGAIYQLPINKEASKILQMNYPMSPTIPIRGNVIIIKKGK